nr:hypothetical protein [Atlantibacter sp.]
MKTVQDLLHHRILQNRAFRTGDGQTLTQISLRQFSDILARKHSGTAI